MGTTALWISTLKTEFKKVVEPTVQKAYWADYLKRNYLTGMALTIVEKENNYEKIWEKLQQSYGNARLLLQNKLGDLDKIGGLWTLTGDDKIATALAKLINSMKELTVLATEHGIEGQLYEGGGLEKIFSLIGNGRHRKFRTENLEIVSKKEEWDKLEKYLEKELKIRERVLLDQKSSKLMGIGSSQKKEQKFKSVNHGLSEMKCHICNNTGHTIITTARGNKIIPYYVCEQFVKMSPKDRLSKLKSKNLCSQCLYPGAVVDSRHKCLYLQYCCPHSSHGSEKIHVLLCESHKSEDANVKLFSKFKQRFIENCTTTLPQFSKNISCFSNMVGIATLSAKSLKNFEDFPLDFEVTESAIFKLQTIEFSGVKLNIFYDCGCGDMIVRKSAVEKLAAINRAKQVVPGPIVLTGVGDQKTESVEGVYSICLPLHNNRNAILTGLCLPKITTKFPTYELSKVEKFIKEKCQNVRPKLVQYLPKLPKYVGGDTDILIGSKHNILP